MITIKPNIIYFYNNEIQNHRINGPAVINNYYQAWCKNGKYHRIGGPAIINGIYQAWYIEGVKYTDTEYHKK